MEAIDFLNKVQDIILSKKNVGSAIARLEQFHLNYPDIPYCDTVSAVAHDYQLMKSFMSNGFHDDKRDELYASLLNRLQRVVGILKMNVLNKHNASFQSAFVNAVCLVPEDIKVQLEAFVQEAAMISLNENGEREPRVQALHVSHRTFMAKLFDAILTSPQWSREQAAQLETLLLSPTVDVVDVQLLVSAIMLSCMNVFDEAKLAVLLHLYIKTEYTVVRQRALIGWVFALPYHIGEVLSDAFQVELNTVLDDETVRRELLELQIQICYCLNAEKDNERIQNDIIPNIMKHNDLSFKGFGVVENEESRLQDILHPEMAEEAMANVEANINKMFDMQKQGVDIYFGGFSQMKRFAFFYTLSNWFLPYYMEHPQLASFRSEPGGCRFLEILQKAGPFCESDKYSFAFAMSSIINKIPENVREMLGSREVFGGTSAQVNTTEPAYIRRSYLQDLYRFFRLYSSRNDFVDAYDTNRKGGAFFFLHPIFRTKMRAESTRLKAFLYQKAMYSFLEDMFQTYTESQTTDELLIRADYLLRSKKYEEAFNTYEEARMHTPDSVPVLRGLLRTTIATERYARGIKVYEMLTTFTVPRKDDTLRYGLALIYEGCKEEGLNEFYRYDYEHEGNVQAKRALGWALLAAGEPEKARVQYDQIQPKDMGKNDYFIKGCILWFCNDVANAVEVYRQYEMKEPSEEPHSLLAAFREEQQLLKQYGKNMVDQYIMNDLVHDVPN